MNDVSEVRKYFNPSQPMLKSISCQGEEDEAASTIDDDDAHRKFVRRNVPLYLPKIIIPKHEFQG